MEQQGLWEVISARGIDDEPNNVMNSPAPISEIPAANVDKAAAYYVSTLASPSIGGTTKAALQASQGGIADCLSPIAPSERPTATWALSFF